MKTEGNGQIIRGQQAQIQTERRTTRDLLASAGVKAALAAALPKHMTADRMARVALTALQKTPKLAECDQTSFMLSLLSAAQLGLEPSSPLGHCWLLPYGRECQLIIGYQGMLDLCYRAGVRVRGNLVREGDVFEIEYGLDQKLAHRPASDADRESRPVTHVYAIGKLPGSNEPVFTVLSRAEVEKYRKRSKSANSGPWVTDWDAMALKTAVRRLFRWLPKSVELQQAIALDEGEERNEQRSAIDPMVLAAIEPLSLPDADTSDPNPDDDGR